MRIKPIITVILLVFVAASVVTAIAKEATRPPATPEQATAVEEAGPRFIAYYFRNNIRCKSCKLIEAYTTETVTGEYADQIEDGLLEFLVVNVDEPEHKHFVKKYALYTKHVVLAEFDQGGQVRWKNLDRVWELLKDEESFRSYIDVEVSNFLDNVPDEYVVWCDDENEGGLA